MREQFITKTFQKDSLTIIEWANNVIARYMADGYTLSLRQLYYQGVSVNLYPNTDASYSKLGNIISEARMAGLVDWDAIEDRGRVKHETSNWDSPKDIITQAAAGFRINKWETQPYHVEVMCEKAALEGVLIPVCDDLQVPFHSNKGYSSASALYRVGKRLQERAYSGKKLVVVYCGDHDPSGLDMSRDVADRLAMFSQSEVTVMRVALNHKQVLRYNLPENPTKMSDSRAPGYVEKFGESSWELDAMDPSILASIVKKAVLSVRDERLWEAAQDKEDDMQDQLQSLLASLG